MQTRTSYLVATLILLVGSAATAPAAAPLQDDTAEDSLHVLVFSKTAGFRHRSIADGIRAIEELGAQHEFDVTATEDSEQFTEENLAQFDVLVFLNTTGDVFNDEQQDALKAYIKAGGGYVGIHAASDTEYDWPWYGRLVGAYFSGHPPVQDAILHVENNDHPSTEHLPATWPRRDEWYNFEPNPRSDENITILATLDESSYNGGDMGDDHPIAWCHEFAGGRAFYTAGGHTSESFSEPEFRQHLLGAIHWAATVDDVATSRPDDT